MLSLLAETHFPKTLHAVSIITVLVY